MDESETPSSETIPQEERVEQETTSPSLPQDDKPGGGKKLAGKGAIALLLFKLKTIMLLAFTKLKFLFISLKYLKLAKIFTTLGSMGFTIVIDAMRWGWAFAFGFVGLIFVHETGHMLALRARGIRAGAPVFIPFVGAFIAMKEMPKDAKTEAEVGIAGPLLGTAGALLCLQLGGPGKMELFTRLAYVGFMLNLFNLLPVLPLDGGRVMAAISPRVWLVGLVLTVVMFLWSHNPIFLILVIMSIGRMWHGIKSKPQDLDYYNVPKQTRIWMTLIYFGLAAFLALMMMELHHK